MTSFEHVAQNDNKTPADFEKDLQTIKNTVEPGTIFLGRNVASNYTLFVNGVHVKFKQKNLPTAIFGQASAVVLPAHGEYNCPCGPCTLHRYVCEFYKKGWEVESIE